MPQLAAIIGTLGCRDCPPTRSMGVWVPMVPPLNVGIMTGPIRVALMTCPGSWGTSSHLPHAGWRLKRQSQATVKLPRFIARSAVNLRQWRTWNMAFISSSRSCKEPPVYPGESGWMPSIVPINEESGSPVCCRDLQRTIRPSGKCSLLPTASVTHSPTLLFSLVPSPSEAQEWPSSPLHSSFSSPPLLLSMGPLVCRRGR